MVAHPHHSHHLPAAGQWAPVSEGSVGGAAPHGELQRPAGPPQLLGMQSSKSLILCVSTFLSVNGQMTSLPTVHKVGR